MTGVEWAALGLQVVATGAAAAIAAWRSVVDISREREAEARRRADEHLKTIHALVVAWSQGYRRDRGHAFEIQMQLRRELQVMYGMTGRSAFRGRLGADVESSRDDTKARVGQSWSRLPGPPSIASLSWPR